MNEVQHIDGAIPYMDEIMEIISSLSGKIGSADANEIMEAADDVDKIRECFNALIIDRRWHKEEIDKVNKLNFESQDANNRLARSLTVKKEADALEEQAKEPDIVDEFAALFD